MERSRLLVTAPAKQGLRQSTGSLITTLGRNAMQTNFHSRLRDYYLKVASVFRGEAEAASVFPNSGNKGFARENVYVEFLKLHAPSKCNVFLGGHLFHLDGRESKQIDVIITTDTAPRFDFFNKTGGGIAFAPVEGTLGVACIKSTLDKKELWDSLSNIASIPPTDSLKGRIIPGLSVPNYEDWPLKVIYANDGISPAAILAHLDDYYAQNGTIPISRRPDVIHVAGSCAVFRAIPGMKRFDSKLNKFIDLKEGAFYLAEHHPDLQAIVWVLNGLQHRASCASHILCDYGELINRVNTAPRK